MSTALVNTVQLADVAPQPWKNGGGTTRELLTWPSAEHWLVRLSVAEVTTDGPFSPFPGVTRHFAVLNGRGVNLEGLGHICADDEPLSFDGTIARHCRLLDGPTTDLNLMVRDSAGRAELRRVSAEQPDFATRGATLSGIYDATNGVLNWTLGEYEPAPALRTEATKSRFQFAFWAEAHE